jgi:hypothetical protein
MQIVAMFHVEHFVRARIYIHACIVYDNKSSRFAGLEADCPLWARGASPGSGKRAADCESDLHSAAGFAVSEIWDWTYRHTSSVTA